MWEFSSACEDQKSKTWARFNHLVVSAVPKAVAASPIANAALPAAFPAFAKRSPLKLEVEVGVLAGDALAGGWEEVEPEEPPFALDDPPLAAAACAAYL